MVFISVRSGGETFEVNVDRIKWIRQARDAVIEMDGTDGLIVDDESAAEIVRRIHKLERDVRGQFDPPADERTIDRPTDQRAAEETSG